MGPPCPTLAQHMGSGHLLTLQCTHIMALGHRGLQPLTRLPTGHFSSGAAQHLELIPNSPWGASEDPHLKVPRWASMSLKGRTNWHHIQVTFAWQLVNSQNRPCLTREVGWTDGWLEGWGMEGGKDARLEPRGGLPVQDRAGGCGRRVEPTLRSSLSLAKPGRTPAPARPPVPRGWLTRSHGEPTPQRLTALWSFLKLFNLTDSTARHPGAQGLPARPLASSYSFPQQSGKSRTLRRPEGRRSPGQGRGRRG